ncbi:hypothetical protein KIPB_015295, partial [Kipferlia bialata]
RALELRPDFVDAINNLGNLLWERGDTKEARILYRRTVELKPGFLLGHLNLTLICRELRDYKEALRHVDVILQANPRYIMITI